MAAAAAISAELSSKTIFRFSTTASRGGRAAAVDASKMQSRATEIIWGVGGQPYRLEAKVPAGSAAEVKPCMSSLANLRSAGPP